ncbi:MAG: ParB/RepB/Spo0J family partition protein [Clostridia bacterium]|nr:ParB/RepB/Spo0J family partition protein [Clostridia bacterium]MBR3993810.1 ParB/RepB/Spo0J family partition protein [Clostridia bacterium]MEE0968714.1 ParB/RepB/Spo0J family partition protein [Clostridia bacterium]MEE1351210.1 ParB/RepB/Spo0J family partition protein [Clostridia bacterium]
MPKLEINIGRSTLDDLFKTDEGRKTEEIKPIKISELKPYAEQPFKVIDNEEMDELVASIKENGVLSPVVARPHPEGGYEILSGHRRVRASELAGKDEVPVVVKDLDDDTAVILLVDSNLQREHILPSEKAFAYQMRLEAMKRKAGRPSQENSAQFGQNTSPVDSRKELAEQTGESSVQIQRYIRLTELIDPLLEMVDTKAMAMNAGVELSYLKPKEQVAVVEAIKSEDTCPSIEQAKKIRRFNDEGRLNPDVILSIMQEQKADKIKITLGDDKLKKYFPKGYSKKQMEDTIIKLLEKWHRKLEMER